MKISQIRQIKLAKERKRKKYMVAVKNETLILRNLEQYQDELFKKSILETIKIKEKGTNK